VKQDGEYPGAHPRTRLRTIDDLDGRTFAAREARKLIAELERDLGGDLSVAQRELVKRPAVLGAIISDHEVAWLEHRPSDLTTYGTLVDRQRRVLEALGLERKACEVTPAFIDMDRLIEEAVEEALEFKNDGFRAIKMKIGLGDLKLDARRVGAVRKAIGPDVKLAVDANHCFSVPNAIKLGRMLEEHDILWFEEPISPEDHDGYIEVTRALDMAVAGGENDFTRWGFRDVIARKTMDIVQPDLCAAGGFSECRKIATLASAFGVECVPHAWGSAIGLAATVQFLAALPDQPPAFRPMPPMLEFEQTPNPLRDQLAVEPIEQKKGIVKVPTGPGLGIEIDREVLKKYKVA